MGLEIISDSASELREFIKKHGTPNNPGKINIGAASDGESIDFSFKPIKGKETSFPVTPQAVEQYIKEEKAKGAATPDGLEKTLDHLKKETIEWEKASKRLKEKDGTEIKPSELRHSAEWHIRNRYTEEVNSGKKPGEWQDYMDNAKKGLLKPGNEGDLKNIKEALDNFKDDVSEELKRLKDAPKATPDFNQLASLSNVTNTEIPGSIPLVGGGPRHRG